MLKPERKNESGHLDKRKHVQCVGETMAAASLDFTALSLLEVTAVGCTPAFPASRSPTPADPSSLFPGGSLDIGLPTISQITHVSRGPSQAAFRVPRLTCDPRVLPLLVHVWSSLPVQAPNGGSG